MIVSTDDDEIAGCVEPTGCDVQRRPQRLGDDDVRVVDVLKNLLGSMPEKFDYLCCLYPTAPLRTAEDIRAAYDLMIARSVDFCCAVTEFDESPFFAFDVDDNSRIRRRWPDLVVLPPSEKPQVVVDNGSLYWARTEAFLELGELESDSMAGYLMPRRRSVDIDTEFDFRLAEFMARQMEKA